MRVTWCPESNSVCWFSTLHSIPAPLLGLLGTCDAVSDSEVLVYGVGTVKLLASNSDLRVQLAENNALSLLSSLLHHYNQVSSQWPISVVVCGSV